MVSTGVLRSVAGSVDAVSDDGFSLLQDNREKVTIKTKANNFIFIA